MARGSVDGYLVSAGSPANKSLGEILQALREVNKLSVTQLATRCGVHPSFIRGIERGAQAPSIETATNILCCFQEHDGYEWTEDSDGCDLSIMHPRTGNWHKFVFKAKVRGQNHRPKVTALHDKDRNDMFIRMICLVEANKTEMTLARVSQERVIETAKMYEQYIKGE